MGAQQNERQISQNYVLHMKFSEFCICFHILVKLDIHFLRIPWEIVFGVITDD